MNKQQTDENVVVSAYAIPGLPAVKKEIRMSREVAKAEKIIENFCQHFGVPVTKVKLKSRKREFVYVRQWCMLFIDRETRLSLKDNGALFGGRDHTTVLHSLDVVSNQLSLSNGNDHVRDYPILRDILAEDCVKRVAGRPFITKRRSIRINTVELKDDLRAIPIIRPKAQYTNTNFEKELETKYNQLAI